MAFDPAILYADNLPEERTIQVVRGDDTTVYFQLENEGGTTVDLTNVTGRMMVRLTADTGSTIYDSTALTPDGSDGILFTIPTATTSGWSGAADDDRNYAVYDIELQETTGATRKRTVQRGSIRLIKDVTR